jgi:hypothetical protein
MISPAAKRRAEFESNKLYGMPRGMPHTFERIEIGRKP